MFSATKFTGTSSVAASPKLKPALFDRNFNSGVSVIESLTYLVAARREVRAKAVSERVVAAIMNPIMG